MQWHFHPDDVDLIELEKKLSLQHISNFIAKLLFIAYTSINNEPPLRSKDEAVKCLVSYKNSSNTQLFKIPRCGDVLTSVAIVDSNGNNIPYTLIVGDDYSVDLKDRLPIYMMAVIYIDIHILYTTECEVTVTLGFNFFHNDLRNKLMKTRFEADTYYYDSHTGLYYENAVVYTSNPRVTYNSSILPL